MFTEIYLQQQAELIFRIFLSCVLGVTIGYERMNRNKGAGVRTHAIVALGAALIMVVSKYGFVDTGAGDSARLAAQVVSGIGFLGAGIIFTKNNVVSGLTTAAGIWATAGVGLCVGAGLYFVGVICTVMIVGVQVFMHKIGFFANEAQMGKLKISLSDQEKGLQLFQKTVSESHVELLMLGIAKKSDGSLRLEADVVYPHGCDKNDFLAKLISSEYATEIKG